MGPPFGPVSAAEGFVLNSCLDSIHARARFGLLLFWDFLCLAKRQELNPHLLFVAVIALTS